MCKVKARPPANIKRPQSGSGSDRYWVYEFWAQSNHSRNLAKTKFHTGPKIKIRRKNRAKLSSRPDQYELRIEPNARIDADLIVARRTLYVAFYTAYFRRDGRRVLGSGRTGTSAGNNHNVSRLTNTLFISGVRNDPDL